MTEFHDGILLFEISGRKVWNRVQEDSLGLHAYYEDHKKEFLTRKSMDARIYTLHSPAGGKKLSAAYRKFSRKPDCDSLMLQKFNRNSDSLLVIREDRFFMGDDNNLDNIKWETGTQQVIIDNYPSIISIRKIYEPEPLSFEEVQGEMMTGYQDFLENEWIRQLKEKYTVKIDNLVLDEIKNRIRNE